MFRLEAETRQPTTLRFQFCVPPIPNYGDISAATVGMSNNGKQNDIKVTPMELDAK
jgi:hypothetical protein